MHRYYFLPLILFCSAAVAQAADEKAKPLTIRWHGQSFFEITSTKGTNVVIDPHALTVYGRKTARADLLLCSHQHNDHTQIGVIENREYKRIDGVTGNQVGKQKWNIVKEEKVKDIAITTVGTYHDDIQGMKRGLNSILIIEVDGLRLVHLGDLGHVLSENDVKRVGKVDVLMIPVGGVYTINGSEAKDVVRQLKPTRFILPMHYGTEVYDDLLPAKEFLEEQKNVEKSKTNELTIDPSSAPEKTAKILLLHWTKPE